MYGLIKKIKALSDANRFRIVMMLKARPLCVCELLDVLDIAGGTLSNHLKILKNSGLIDQKKDGRWVEYYLKDDISTSFIGIMESHMEDPSQINADRDRISKLSREICSSQTKK